MENRIKAYRKSIGISQISLAKQAGLTRQTIGLLESGSYNPSLKVCLSIADVLETNLDNLFNPKYFKN